jgi:hypothetical protein
MDSNEIVLHPSQAYMASATRGRVTADCMKYEDKFTNCLVIYVSDK